MLISPTDKNIPSNIGQKAKSLIKLNKAGFLVPTFFIISSELLESISSQKDKKESILNNIKKELANKMPNKKFAVRSNHLSEDGSKTSNAGKYKTILDVSLEDIGLSLSELIKNSQKNGKIKDFSVIIQDMIEGDYSGVVFTRSPLGEREMVIEYTKGRGDKLVSGEKIPKKMNFSWRKRVDNSKFKNFNNFINDAKKIEGIFNFPQDIEWTYKKGKFYFLQSRNITSINKDDYDNILYLDKKIKEDKYYLEKTYLSESVPRPNPIMKDILSEIYKKNGPVDFVYKKYKIKYSPKNFLKTIGNEAYTDREEELKSIFPAKSYFYNNEIKEHYCSFSGFTTTILNTFYFSKLKNTDPRNLILKLKKEIEKKREISDPKKTLEELMESYKLIFEVNLLTSLIDKNKNDYKYLKLNQSDFNINFNNKDIKGNSIDISDESRTVLIKPDLEKSKLRDTLREYARWLSIKKINYLRLSLYDFANKNGFKEESNILFCSLSEIFNGEINEKKSLIRKKKYGSKNKLNLPSIITSGSFLKTTTKNIGVSPGISSGVAFRETDVRWPEKGIMLVKNLRPGLVEYFDRISGIVSEKGGELSHLAILAREKGLPVVISDSCKKIRIGQSIEINGSSGKIKNLSKQLK